MKTSLAALMLLAILFPLLAVGQITYTESNSASDLTGGTLACNSQSTQGTFAPQRILTSGATAGSWAFSVGANLTRTFTFYTNANNPNLTIWPGTSTGNVYTVNLNVTSASGFNTMTIDSACILRVNSAGTLQATVGTATGIAIALNSTGKKTFTITGTQQSASATDRMAVVIVLKNARSATQTFTLGAASATNSIITTPAGAPVVSLTSSLTYASQTVSTTSAAQTATISNTGTTDLSVTNVALTGTNSADYAISGGTCSGTSFTVAAGSSCTKTVTFTPLSTGTRTASLTFTDNASGSPHSTSLSGTGNTACTSGLDQATVQAAVTAAARNGNVTLGAGSCSWSSRVTITKGVHIAGAGFSCSANPYTCTGNTAITNTAAAQGEPLFDIEPDATALANEETIEISGFDLSGNTTNGTDGVGLLIYILGANSSASKPVKNIIIRNNKLKNTLSSTWAAIYQQGQARGVIANNTFDRVGMPFRPIGNDTLTEWTNSAYYPFSYGSADNMYFETNYIEWSSAYTDAGTFGGVIQTEQGPRAVIRYNTWNYANYGSTASLDLWDFHGFQNWPLGQTSTMLMEYYGNTVTTSTAYGRMLNLRGSQSLTFNNILTVGSGASSITINQYDNGCNSVVGSPDGVSFNGEPNNTYLWNNTAGGSEIAVTVAPAVLINNTCPPVNDASFWKYNASCTASSCASGIGRGTTAPTGTCTTGVAYWVASTATPTVSSSVIQNAHLYKCTSTNVWTSYYTPYSYPNPLLGSYASLSSSTFAFGNQATGGTSGSISSTLTNSGSVTLNISSVAVSGSVFNLTNGCGSTLAAGATCNISATFSPIASTPYSETITVTHDGLNGPTSTIALTGTGTGPPQVTCTLTSDKTSVQPGRNATLTLVSADATTANLWLDGVDQGSFGTLNGTTTVSPAEGAHEYCVYLTGATGSCGATTGPLAGKCVTIRKTGKPGGAF